MNTTNEPTVRIALICTSITTVVAVFSLFFSTCENRKLERDQFESNLILKAIETSNIDSSKRNLDFLVKAGFLSEKNEIIVKVLTDSILQIKFPKVITKVAEPKNNYTISEYDVFYSLIVDDTGDPLDSVLIRITKTKRSNDKYIFALTYSDNMGLFKLPIPNTFSPLKIMFSKNGYETKALIVTSNSIKGLKKIQISKQHYTGQ